MARWTSGWVVVAAVLGMVAGSRSEALSASAAPAHVPGPAAPVLTGLTLGQGLPLPACRHGHVPPRACLHPDAAGDADPSAQTPLQTLQLAHSGPLPGLQQQAVVLQLGQALESVSLQFEGIIALEGLPLLLGQLCGAPEVDSHLPLDEQAYLRAISWQCPDGDVQLTALWRNGHAQGALNLTTARGQAWFDGELPAPQTLAMR